MFTKTSLVVVLFGFISSLNAQSIINTSSISHDLDSTISILADLSGNFSRGNAEINDINVSGGVGISATKNSSFWVLGGLNLLTSGDEKIQSVHFIHLRYNYELSDRITLNAFTQFQANSVLAVTYRELFGVNFGYDFDSSDRNTLMFGVFREFEKYEDASQSLLYRANVVGNTEIKLKQNNIVGFIYFQPSLKEVSDYRLIGELSFLIPLASFLELEINLASRYDSNPISNIGRWDIGSTIGLHVEFMKG
jgi:hypothetical protein